MIALDAVVLPTLFDGKFLGAVAVLLEFIYPRLPNSATELTSRISGAGLDAASASEIVAHRFAEASERPPKRRVTRLTRFAAVARVAPRVLMPEIVTNKIASAGVFKGKTIAAFERELPKFIRDIMTALGDVRSVENPVQSWEATLPTQSVYADLTLGVCSGAEDYLEIQRQYDLETRKFEIEKLKCEINKLKVETQRLQSGEPSMVVQSDADQPSVNLNITSGETPSGIKIQSPGP